MSIRVIGTTPTGSAHLYHSSPSLGEHFWVGRVRRDARGTYLTCALCDACTVIPRHESNADHREVQALIDAGKVTPLAHPDNTPLDPLQAGKDDGNVSAFTVIPQDTAGRKALREMLKAAHKDVRPAGTRFQIRVGKALEVREDDGTGVAAKVETYDVADDGKMTRRVGR